MEDSKFLKPKEFDAEKHKKIISQLRPHMDLKNFKGLLLTHVNQSVSRCCKTNFNPYRK